jgi:uncharacterized protein (DUF488 family)
MIYTIGHSTFPADELAGMMLAAGVDTLLDTRSHPGSKWPWHRKEEMEISVPKTGIGYEWWPNIGGWLPEHAPLADSMAEHEVQIASYLGRGFPKQRIAATEAEVDPNGPPRWTNTGLRDYSYYMATPGFMEGVQCLIHRGQTENVAIMCCECQWWRCHRSMISDYLAYLGVPSYHIMPRVRQKNLVKFVDGIKVSPHAECLGNRLERYEDYTIRAWEHYHRGTLRPWGH